MARWVVRAAGGQDEEVALAHASIRPSTVDVPVPAITKYSSEVATGAVTTSSPGAMRTNEASSAGEVAGPLSTPRAADRSNGTIPVRTAR